MIQFYDIIVEILFREYLKVKREMSKDAAKWFSYVNCASSSVRCWFWFALFACVWGGLRFLWLDCDPGVPSVWEYGYYVTDEGYYLGAGKEKYLWGAFNDLSRSECFSYGYSAGTHWLSYLAYLVFGLTDWGWRVPFVLIYFAAWSCIFHRAAKLCGPAVSFLLCSAVSCMPFVVAYERSAGNDLTIASIGAIAYCTACGRGIWRIPFSALICASAMLIKPSVWLLIPMVAAGVLDTKKTRHVWLDAFVFVALAVLAAFGFKQLVVLSVLPEVAANGVSAAEIVRRTTTHNQLPALFDIANHLRGIAAFPRDPMLVLMSVSALFVTLVPLSLVVRDVLNRRWRARMLLGLSVPVFVAGVSSMNTVYLHYYHPVVVMIPIIFAEVWRSEDEAGDDCALDRRKFWTSAGLSAATCALLLFISAFRILTPQAVMDFYSRIYNLPRLNVWMFNGLSVLIFGALITAALGSVRGLKVLRQEGCWWFLLGCVGGSVALAGLPAVYAAPYMKIAQMYYLAPVALMLAVAGFFLFVSYALPAGNLRRRTLSLLPVAAVLLSFILVPCWRSATAELLARGVKESRAVAAEISKIVPPDAIVIGERSNQVLMGTALRTATTMPASNPIPIVSDILSRNPDAKIYVLADSQHAYNIQHFQKNAERYRLELVKRFKMRSFGSGHPADVFLCRLSVLSKGGEKSK
jgi:4-amino-4-deoxy-L-arabinose transferase-like glycosyltransferase